MSSAERGDQAKLVGWAMRGTSYTGSDLLVLVALAERGDERGVAYPSIQDICEDTRCAERSVQYALRRLEADGWVTIQRQRSRKGTNLYQLDVPRLRRCAEAEQARRRARFLAQEAPAPCGKDVQDPPVSVENVAQSVEIGVEKSGKGASAEAQGVQSVHLKGAMVAPKGCTGLHPNPQEPPKNPQGKIKSKISTAAVSEKNVRVRAPPVRAPTSVPA